jgi:hypothetical protein
MGEYSFKEDIIQGEAGEDFVIEYLTKGWKGNLLEKKKDFTWDFKLEFKDGELIQTFELKTDVFCVPDTIINGRTIRGKDTGNIFIEFSCRGKDSGVKVTQADWFVYYYKFLGELWLIKVDELKDLIANNNFKVGVGGDPGSNSSGYLIPRKKFRDNFLVRTQVFEEAFNL